MLSHSPLPEPSVVEPLAVLSGAGNVTVRLVDAAGQRFALRMGEASALALAAMLAAGPAVHAARTGAPA